MKKRNLKSLSLNKKSISHLTGGTVSDPDHGFQDPGTRSSCYAPCPRPSKVPILCPQSVVDVTGCNSENGCTGGPDQTMTCADYSCAC